MPVPSPCSAQLAVIWTAQRSTVILRGSSVGGDVRINSVLGMTVAAIGGDLDVTGAVEAIEVHSVGGDAEISDARGPIRPEHGWWRRRDQRMPPVDSWSAMPAVTPGRYRARRGYRVYRTRQWRHRSASPRRRQRALCGAHIRRRNQDQGCRSVSNVGDGVIWLAYLVTEVLRDVGE